MAQNKNTKKSKGLCKKIQNAVSPFIKPALHTSHQPQGSVSVGRNEKPASPSVRVLRQTSHSKMVPVEIEPMRDFAEREVVIVSSRKFSKLIPKKESSSQPDDDRFSEYISKVKDRMMKTASNASGGGGEVFSVKDSFDDKVTNYIARTKIKVRKTTSVGNGKGFSFLK